MITVDLKEMIFTKDGRSLFELLERICTWCENQYGPMEPGGLWRYHGMGKFAFREQSDAVLFRLRWS